MSLFDLRIGFGEAMPDRTVKPRVGVVMSPEQAAILALLLIGQVAQYEKNFGPLRDPRWREFADQASQMTLPDNLGQPHAEPTAQGG